jgi:DNA-binding MarR family transcriptional regulator
MMTPSPPAPDLGIVDGLVQMSMLVVSALAAAAAPHELSMLQCRLLGVLRDREPTMAQLARLLGLDKSSTTGVVDRAQRRGLVERVADPGDGRAWRVVLTAAGRALTETALADVNRQIMALTDGLGDVDRDRLSLLTSQIVARHADRHGIDPTAGMIPSAPLTRRERDPHDPV